MYYANGNFYKSKIIENMNNDIGGGGYINKCISTTYTTNKYKNRYND